MPAYPHTPGAKASGTSAASARKMAGVCEILRLKAVRILKRHRLTADEVAKRMGESILSVRPRMSELKRLGKIKATGARRPNASGHSANVWRAL